MLQDREVAVLVTEHLPEDGKSVLTTYTEIADILENLPLLVREHRRSRGLSLRQASAQSGVDFSTLTRLEQCANTGLVSVVLVLRWMGFNR
ncbi:HTH_XRE domain containing protein [uncultured Caudovirales phage]|uniref:HTH_XRE domain containing protein n=1 Tax=uncultured Caudovirales phage TaxID=2100421 RepID=A0A6J5QK98_9CAUD|nr:HTH_XRE domain containing protein [uncultured Caudovirales phage]CAB4215619.1 HTH_XRE domain containing protein [uncultured Caudovirales phage]